MRAGRQWCRSPRKTTALREQNAGGIKEAQVLGEQAVLSSPKPSALARERRPAAGCSMRVLFVVPGDGAGSSLIFARRQIEALREAGVAGEEFYLSSRTSPSILWRERRRFRKAVRAFRPDLVHAHYGTMTAFFCALSTRLPLVITFRGSDLNPCPGVSKVRSGSGRFLSQFAALRARRVICVSEGLRQRLWWRLRQAHVVPSGIDTSLFRPWPRSQARAELGWPSDQPVVLFNAGRNPAGKRLDLAREAVQLARARCERLGFIVLEGGTPPHAVPAYMNAADCLLVTSAFEGSPNMVKEALACNLPIISVKVGDVAERLAGVEPSRIVSGNPEEIAQALVEIASTPLRSNGREKVQEIDSAAIAERILSVYRSVLQAA